MQNAERILHYAKDNGLKRIAVTDHYWDSAVPGASSRYAPQNFEHIQEIRPFPSYDGIDFLFGCETEMREDGEADTVLRPFRIAKHMGCKFYLGSDAHHPSAFNNCTDLFERAITLLDLKESDKFNIAR